MYSPMYSKLYDAMRSAVSSDGYPVLYWTPLDLFGLGSQGFWYDPSDLSTLFQDVAGTIPVTAVGQPVGLMLDKRLGLVRSSEAWADAGAVFAGSSSRVSPGVYRIYSPDGSSSQVAVTSGVAGRFYEVSVTIDSIAVGAVTTDFANSPTWTTTGSKKFIAYLIGTSFTFKRAGVTDAQISNVSVRELPGNHQLISVPASRPILRKNAITGAYYLETDGVDDYMVSAPINFTSTDKVTIFCGIRKLNDTAAFPVILETGASAADIGSFHLYSNASTVTRGYAFAATGLTQVWRRMSPDYAAPDSAVITAMGDLSATGDAVVPQRRNGVLQALVMGGGTSTGGGTFANLPLNLFRRNGATLPWAGHFYGLIGIGRLATAVELAQAERWLARRVGVAL